jgi:hypothetical protein
VAAMWLLFWWELMASSRSACSGSYICSALRPVFPDASFFTHEWPELAVSGPPAFTLRGETDQKLKIYL